METKTIQSDFDKLALLDAEGWNHNNHYHAFLLRQIPQNCGQTLEIGCGTGSFSRGLAHHADRVLALDLSPEMIRIAREHSEGYSNIEYQVADVLTWDFPESQFDCIVSIATMHHLPLENMLRKMRFGLKPNGILLVLDLCEAEGVLDWMANLIAVPVHTILKLKNTGRLRESAEIRAAWAAHGAHDSYLSVFDVRCICQRVLPGAIIKKHLLWRYSIVWKKPERGSNHEKYEEL